MCVSTSPVARIKMFFGRFLINIIRYIQILQHVKILYSEDHYLKNYLFGDMCVATYNYL